MNETQLKEIKTKLSEFEDNKTYTRGRDYPAHAYSKLSDKERVPYLIKVSMGLTGKEIKERFADDPDILLYPQKDGYTGSLP